MSEERGSSDFLPPPDSRLAELVAQAQAGDEDAYADLVQHYEKLIYSFLYHLIGNPDIAYELTEMTFVRVWKALPHTNEETREKFKSYIFTVAKNLARDHFALRKHINSISLDALDNTTDWSPATHALKADEHLQTKGAEDEVYERIHTRECMQKALAQMSSRYRACFYLKYFEGCTNEEIALRLRITVSSVSSYATRGRQQFKTIFTDLYYGPGTEGRGGLRA